jgi:hypothetical protein
MASAKNEQHCSDAQHPSTKQPERERDASSGPKAVHAHSSTPSKEEDEADPAGHADEDGQGDSHASHNATLLRAQTPDAFGCVARHEKTI